MDPASTERTETFSLSDETRQFQDCLLLLVSCDAEQGSDSDKNCPNLCKVIVHIRSQPVVSAS